MEITHLQGLLCVVSLLGSCSLLVSMCGPLPWCACSLLGQPLHTLVFSPECCRGAGWRVGQTNLTSTLLVVFKDFIPPRRDHMGLCRVTGHEEGADKPTLSADADLSTRTGASLRVDNSKNCNDQTICSDITMPIFIHVK